jgi:hypothetical protein
MRLESLCLRADDVPSLGAVRRAIAEAVNLVVQLERVPAVVNGRPCIHQAVTEIAELVRLARPGREGRPSGWCCSPCCKTASCNQPARDRVIAVWWTISQAFRDTSHFEIYQIYEGFAFLPQPVDSPRAVFSPGVATTPQLRGLMLTVNRHPDHACVLSPGNVHDRPSGSDKPVPSGPTIQAIRL